MNLVVIVLLQITFGWRPSFALQERTVVLLYNKPPNVVTSHAEDDIKGRQNVYQDIYSMKGWVGMERNEMNGNQHPSALSYFPSFADVTRIQSRLHAVGRLDAETTGALLLTNDGGLVHHVTNREATVAGNGAHAVSKTYHAVIMGHYSNDADIFEQMRNHGVDIGEKYGGQTLAVEDLYVLDHPSPKSTAVSLTISEGKNRQVRRMFHALGSGVMKLQRISIGNGLDLGNLKEGQWRILSDEEVQNCLSYSPRCLDAPLLSSSSLRKSRSLSGKSRLKRRNVRRSK